MDTNKVIWLLCTIAFGVLLFITILVTKIDYNIYKNGKLVKVIITYVPTILGSRGSGDIKFIYNGEHYSITIHGAAIESYHVNDTIQLRYLKGHEDRFLSPNYNPIYTGCISFMLFFTLLILSARYLINPPNLKLSNTMIIKKRKHKVPY